MSTAATSLPAAPKTSFFKKVEAFFKKVFTSTKWETTASSTLLIVGPLLQTVITLLAGAPAGSAVGGILADIQTDLGAAKAFIDDANLTGATSSRAAAVNLLNSVKTNLPQLLAAAEVKNSGKQAEITSIVNTITGELGEILSAAPSA